MVKSRSPSRRNPIWIGRRFQGTPLSTAEATQNRHTCMVSDLYAMGFCSKLTVEEYERESGWRADVPVPNDVAAEQARYSVAELEASGCCYQAMQTAMLTDRIGQRARSCEFVVFGGSVLGNDVDGAERWATVKAGHLAQAVRLARSI